MSPWYTYILRCSDNTLYTGVTNQVKDRVKAHNSGKGAKYTRSRLPVVLVWRKKCKSHGAAVHDSNVFEGILDGKNSSRDVWADSAYRSEEKLKELGKLGFREHIQRKGSRNRKLTERELKGNHTRSRIRSRVEHIFGIQAKRAGNLILRCIGIVRAKAKIGLRNLAYNIDRYATLASV